ncbi:MAG: hypothetical protein ACJ77N_03225, partial [Chloroflexota bacterium]
FDDVAKSDNTVADWNGDAVIRQAIVTMFAAHGITLATSDSISTAARYTTDDGTKLLKRGDLVRDLSTGEAWRFLGVDDTSVDLGMVVFSGPNWVIELPIRVSTLVAGSSWTVVDGNGVAYDVRKEINGALTVSRATISVVAAAAALAVGIGGTAGVAIAGAGAVAINSVTGKTNAYFDNSDIRSAGPVSITSTSGSAISAVVVAVAVAVGGGGTAGVGVAIGISVARNFIGASSDGTPDPLEVKAYSNNTSISAGGALQITATASQAISAVVIAAAAAIAVGGNVGVGIAGSGVWAENVIRAHVKALVDGDGANGISATSILVRALDTSKITALAGAASVALAFAGEGAAIAVSIGVSLARNTIANQVEAAILNADGPAHTSAQTSAAIAVGDRVRQVSTGSIFAYTGLPGTLNLSTQTYDAAHGWTLISTGPITVQATEAASIDAISFAASLAAAGAFVGVAVSGAGAWASNIILTRTNAHIDSSILKSTGAVAITASDTSSIKALILALSVAVGGGAVGVGASIGLALAENLIGYDPDPTTTYTYLYGDNVLTLHTGDRVKISDGIRAGNVYEYLGPTYTVPFDFLSSAATSTVTTGKRVKVVATGTVYRYVGSTTLVNLDLTAQDYSDITKWQRVSALDQDYGDTSLWKRVDLTSASAQVRAYISDSSIDAAGALTIMATESATIDAIVVAASVAISGGVVGASLSGAGAAATNRIATQVQAFIDGDGPTGIKATTITLSATDGSGINAVVGAASVAAGFGVVGAALSIAVSIAWNEVRNDVRAYIANANPGVTTTTGPVSVTATTQGRFVFTLGGFTPAQLDDAATATSDDPATSGTDEAAIDRTGDAAILTSLATAFGTANEPLSTVSTVASSWKFSSNDGTRLVSQGDIVLLADGYAGGGTAGRLYRYVPSSDATLDLSIENYGGANWAPVTILPRLSTLTAGSMWVLVAPDGTTYIISKDPVTGALSVSHSTINVIVAAASVAVGGGLVGIAISGAGAFAENVVLTKTDAYIADSKVTSHTDVSINAAGTSAITATVIAASVAIGGGGYAGVAASIGVSLAHNEIGTRVEAFIANAVTGVTSTVGAIVLMATEGAT